MRLLLLALLAFAPLSAAFADDPPPPADASSKKPRLDRLSTHGLLKATIKDLAPKAQNDREQSLIQVMTLVDQNADQAEAKQKGSGEDATRAGLEQINDAAAEADEADRAARDNGTGTPMARALDVSVARLNNRAGNSADAEAFASRGIKDDPDARDAYVERATARVGLEHYDAALLDANKAVGLDPQSADGYRARAMAEFGLHNFQQAGEDARRALALDPDDRTSFAIMKLVEGRVPKVDIDKLRARMAGEIMGEYHGMLQQLNEADERRQAVEGAGRLWPNAANGSSIPSNGPFPAPSGEVSAPAASATAGFVQDAAGRLVGKDYVGALEQADKALAKDPNNVAAYFYRSTADNLLGRYDEAERDATRALQLNPGDAPSHDARAYALNHLGRFRDAIADSNHSLEINPQNAYAYANLGYSHERMGDLLAMIGDLKTAATLNAQFEPAYRDAASRHGLSYEPVTDDGAAAQESERAAREAARRKQFLFVVGSSVFGGLLIALGFIQLFRPAKPAETSAPRTAIAPEPPQLPPASRGAITLGKQIGLGGMGIVYEGFDRALERKVAVKAVREELRRDDAAKQRFLSEARTVAALHHPGIVDIHSIVEDGANLYLVFEFVEGRTVHELIAERGRLPLREAKAVAAQVCRALDFAHRRGVVHRDLKPANIMVAADGTVKLMDFGISRAAGEFAASGVAYSGEQRTGTPDYMAPEQRLGAVRRESDVFSLGACLYEMVTGRRPFPPNGDTIAAGQFPRASSLVPELPAALDAFFVSALHPDPERRIGSARDFWALLDRIKEPVAASS